MVIIAAFVVQYLKLHIFGGLKLYYITFLRNVAVLKIDSTMELCYSCLSLSRQSLHVCQKSLLDNLSSQSKERCSTEAQSSGAGHTHTLLLAFRPLRHQNSNLSGTWGQILDLLLCY